MYRRYTTRVKISDKKIDIGRKRRKIGGNGLKRRKIGGKGS